MEGLMNDGALIERRKSRRLKVEFGALTLLDADSNDACGKILNISRGGLAYLGATSKEKAAEQFTSNIIWSGNNALLLSHIPCKSVWHFDITKRSFFRKEKQRVQGVQFGELTAQQTAQLEYCLEKHTIIEE
jgi:hypothetical protein